MASYIRCSLLSFLLKTQNKYKEPNITAVHIYTYYKVQVKDLSHIQ